MTQVAINELPESFQRLLLEVEQTKTPLTVTQSGQPLVVIYPAKTPKPRPAPGFMKGSGEIIGDIVAPLDELWEVLK